LLIRDQRLVGELKNTRLYNVLGWGTFGMITLVVLVMLVSQLFEAFGIHLSGG
jgi:Mn2+/Fe2+ NRAMP family transporter